MKKNYRTDIDGMRAFAVISVILFHLGLLPNGYLGVDIFFVISGYLITGIIYNEVKENRFSIFSFYERRIRRIIPLVLFTTMSALITGIILMSPFDLDTLSQNVFASNFSVYNILMYTTSNDYWAVQNEYNPMMHMWSLGIEEQFYLLFPFIFLTLKGNKQKFILPLLIFLTFISFSLFYYNSDASAKFYLLQYRFFELSLGGIAAIYFSTWELNKKQTKSSEIILFTVIILIFLIIQFDFIPHNDIKIIIITFLTIVVLVIGKYHFKDNELYKLLFSNKIISSIGKISFSLYLWHQIVFAFARYKFNLHVNSIQSVLLSIILIIILSIFTYFLVEQPFRNKQFIKTKSVYKVVGLSFIIIVSSSFYVNKINGRVKDFPQLNITKTLVPREYNNFDMVNNSPALYNDRIKILDKPFKKNSRPKVLIIGNSFGRDFANILLETKLNESIELSYFDPWKADITNELINRTHNANYIFYSSDVPTNKLMFDSLIKKFKIDINKVWIVGLKNFGINNGLYNNFSKDNIGCDKIRTAVRKDIWKANQDLRLVWNDRYIDLMELIIDAQKNVPVFTEDCKFISHDSRHLTKFGAMFFSDILEERLKDITK